MENSTYNETFLPLRFFLNRVAVHCPSCNKKGYITTDVPPVAEQDKVYEVFLDCGTYSSHYLWSTASFLCCSCQKRITFDNALIVENIRKRNAFRNASSEGEISESYYIGHPPLYACSLKTWHGPIIAIAEAICPACIVFGYKQKISAKKTIIKKTTPLPKNTQLNCNKCNTKVDAEWKYQPNYYSKIPTEVTCNTYSPGMDVTCNYTPNYSSTIPIDHIFGLELFAQQRLGKHIVWAYNLEHLNHMKAYIQATQRKTNFTILTSGYHDLQRLDSRYYILSFSQTLPTWMKAKSNRVAVLKALEELMQKV